MNNVARARKKNLECVRERGGGERERNRGSGRDYQRKIVWEREEAGAAGATVREREREWVSKREGGRGKEIRGNRPKIWEKITQRWGSKPENQLFLFPFSAVPCTLVQYHP